jgi:hypothetical protein
MGYFARALPSISERRKISQVILFAWRKPVKPNSKETSVQLANRAGRRFANIFHSNDAAPRDIPCLVPPLLQKIGVPFRYSDRFGYGVLSEVDSLFFHWGLERAAGVAWSEQSDRREIEKSLGAGFGTTGQRGDLRQRRAGERWATLWSAIIRPTPFISPLRLRPVYGYSSPMIGN